MTETPIRHYSGILVITLPGQFDTFLGEVESQDGVTAAIRDPERDRVIVVLDAVSRDRLAELHRFVAARPEVVIVNPIVHYVDQDPDENGPGAPAPPGPQEQSCSRP